MDRKKNYYYSLFNRFISLIFLIFLSLAFCITWKIENLHKKNINENLNYITTSINHSISNNIHDTESKMRFLAALISNEQTKISGNRIVELLQLFSTDAKIRMMQWLPISWANNQYIIESDSYGLIKTSINLHIFML